MSELCTFSRPLTCAWIGSHNPLSAKAKLLAETAPATTSWTAAAIRNESTTSYCFGYGQAFMNGYFDEQQRPMGQGLFGDFSKTDYNTQGLLVQLKIALSMSARVERGTNTLVLHDSHFAANSWNNLDGNAKSWGQLIKHLSLTETLTPTSMYELQQGALGYDNSVAFFEKYKRIVLLLSGSSWMPSDELCSNLADTLTRGGAFVCLQADGYNANGNRIFDKVFQSIGLVTAGPNFLHLYEEAVTDYKSMHGDDVSWKSINTLYGSARKLFVSGCSAYTFNKNMPIVQLEDAPGLWRKGACVEVPFNDSVYIPNVVVFRPNCCYSEGEVYEAEFDVPSTVIKPSNWQVAASQGLLRFDWWHELQTPEHVPEVLHVKASGWHASGQRANTPNAIRYRGQSWTTQRSWNIMVFSRETGDVLDFRTYDVYVDAAKGTEFAGFLNAQGSDKIVLVVTSDEPTRNLSQAMINALVRYGASEAIIRGVKVRSAYMMIGIAGEDVAIERFADVPAESPNAIVTMAIDFRPDGARPLDIRMGDTDGNAVVATIQGIAERTLFQSNWDAYRNSKALASSDTAAFNRRFVANVLKWIRRGSGNNVLFIPTVMSTTAEWAPLNPTPNGCASFLSYVRDAGFEVSILDHTKINRPLASAYAKYDAVIFWAGGGSADDVNRMQILMPVIQTVVKGGAGLFAISDTEHPIMNSLAAMYSVRTKFLPLIQQATFVVERAKSQYGNHEIWTGLVGSFNNDTAAGGYVMQQRLLWPYCVDGEALDFIQLKENGRIARLRYRKILDGMDNRHVFTLDAWTKLTDMRFKKIDMSDTDKWPLSIELPCVMTDDEPQFSIDDISVVEGDSGHTKAIFTVSLAAPLRGRPAIVNWRVVDGTATMKATDNAKTLPRSLLIDADGNWQSVYVEYDSVRIVADGAFPKFYNNQLADSATWHHAYFKNIFDWMQRGRPKRKVLFLGDQPAVNVNYATLGTKDVDFGIGVPATIRSAGYTVESMVWQNFKGGNPTVADMLQYDSILFISSTTSIATAIPDAFSKNLEVAIRQGVGLFAITDHDVFTKSFTRIMNRFGIRIYNDPSESSMVYFDQCRAVLGNQDLLKNITVPSFRAAGSISAFILDEALIAPPDIDPPFTGEVVFRSNEVTKTIEINVIGETLREDDEYFFVDLFDQSRGDIVRGRGTGTILNDDGDIFNTRYFEKRVSWSGYIAGGDEPTTPDVNLFMIPVPDGRGHQWMSCSVWISRDKVNVVESDRSGWSATYKFSVGRATSARIYILDDDSSNTKIYNSAGSLIFEWGSGGGSSQHDQALSLPKDDYTVVCNVNNDANGNNYGSNPGYLGISIRRV